MKDPQVIKILFLIVFISFLIITKGVQSNDPQVKGEENVEGYYIVEEVIDGDTIKVKELGTVRAIGIDTPETVDPRKEVECFGIEASNKAEELLEGEYVRLEFDSSQGDVDRYGRILAYIYMEDGRMFNEIMIKDGYAYEYTYDTEYEYQSIFKNAEEHARELKLGLWGSACQ